MAVFFDYNATTPLRPEAREAWLEAVDAWWLNPSSPYRAAAAVKVRLDAARERLGRMLEIAPERIVFNSGATEGNNAVFTHWARRLPQSASIAVHTGEHPSVVEAAKRSFGERVVWLEPNGAGQVAPEAVRRAISDRAVAAVSVMAANNETGALQAWGEMAAICRDAGVPYHCDASQWIGKQSAQGLAACAFLTGCGHKFGGPRGTGFLVVPESSGDYAALFGGSQQGGHRAGTEDVAGALAMVAALEAAVAEQPSCGPGGRDAFVAAIRSNIPDVGIVGAEGPRLWNTAACILPEFTSTRWIRMLEQRGFLVSAGSACSTGHSGPSHVLAAMGYPADAMRRVLRVSGGWSTPDSDWLLLAEAMAGSYAALRADAATSGSQVISI